MKEFPHIYTTSARGTNEQTLELSSEGLQNLQVSPPTEFGGPAGFWSPETLFSAAVSTCFILTFKSIARAMKISWSEINVDVDAYLDKDGGALRFSRVEIFVTLQIPEGGNVEVFEKALKKAESSCLITNSINGTTNLNLKVKAG